MRMRLAGLAVACLILTYAVSCKTTPAQCERLASTARAIGTEILKDTTSAAPERLERYGELLALLEEIGCGYIPTPEEGQLIAALPSATTDTLAHQAVGPATRPQWSPERL